MPQLQRFEHLGDERGFVLQVAVHDDDHLAVRGLHAPVDGRGEAALLDTLDAPDIVVAEAKRAHGVGRAVGRIVVDDHELPGAAGERLREAIVDHRDVACLVVGRHDDRDLRHHHGRATAIRRLPQPR